MPANPETPIFDDIKDKQEALERLLRRESLRKEFLSVLFSSDKFINALNYARKILVSKRAEHGIIIYKKVNSNRFKFVSRYGLPPVDLEDLPIGYRDDLNAYVDIGDKPEEIVRLGIKPERFVRIGSFHTHPHSTNWFSSDDMELYDDHTVGVEGASEVIVPCAHEMFVMLGSIPYRSENSFELFGASMPIGGHKSNLYQRGFSSGEDMERVIRACGFRAARVLLPVVEDKLIIGSKDIDQLSKIGG